MFFAGILFESVGQHIYSAFKAAAARRAIRPLLAVEERYLRDIGITRADVIDSLAQPLTKDPSDLLIERRGTADRKPKVGSQIDRLTIVSHPARWRAERSPPSSPATSPARIDRAAA